MRSAARTVASATGRSGRGAIISTTARAPALIASHAIATVTAAEMLMPVGDDPPRIRSKAARATLRRVCPVPAERKDQSRPAPSWRQPAGHAAPYRVAIVRLCNHQSTLVHCTVNTTRPRMADNDNFVAPLDGGVGPINNARLGEIRCKPLNADASQVFGLQNGDVVAGQY